MMAQSWIGTLICLLGMSVMVGIRIPFDRRRRLAGFPTAPISALERTLLMLMGVGLVGLPLIQLFTKLLASADRPQSLPLFSCGGVLLSIAVRLFARAHSDLGDNWSPIMELRREHGLVVRGIYSKIRHPMYAALLLYSVAQALLIANWIAGWAALIATLTLVVVRLRREEAMMTERFGDEYRDYAARTSRVIPGLW